MVVRSAVAAAKECQVGAWRSLANFLCSISSSFRNFVSIKFVLVIFVKFSCKVWVFFWFCSFSSSFCISQCWPTTLAVNGCCVSVDLIPGTACLSVSLFMCCFGKFFFAGVVLTTAASYILFQCFPFSSVFTTSLFFCWLCLTELFLSLLLQVFKSAFSFDFSVAGLLRTIVLFCILCSRTVYL